MLYFLYPLADQFHALNVFRYITLPLRRGGRHGAGDQLCDSARASSPGSNRSKATASRFAPMARKAIWSRKKGTPTMGGFLILLALTVSTLLWADLANLYVWIVLAVTVGFGLIGFFDDYRKLTRRSHHGVPGRDQAADRDRRWRPPPASRWRFVMPQPLANTVAVPFFKNVLLNLGWFFRAVRRAGHRRRLERGQSDRRPRRAGDRAVDDRGRLLRLDRLPRRQRGIRQLPAAPSCPARRRADRILRRDGRGEPRLSVVQRAARQRLHGRYRVAVDRRRARHDQRRHQARTGARDHRRPVRARGGLGHRPGRQLQDDRTARVPHGAAAPSFRAEGLGGTDNRDPLLDHRRRSWRSPGWRP